MNSWLRIDSTDPRTILAYRGTLAMPTATMRLKRPGPSDAAIAIASSVDGIESSMSIVRMMILSVLLP